MYQLKPAYKLTCSNCHKYGLFYFDMPLPTACPSCHKLSIKVHNLETGTAVPKKK